MTVEISGLHYFDSREEANEALAKQIAEQLTLGIESKGLASLWCSGGSTPTALYQTLAKSNQVVWEKVLISLVDERWVPPTDEASNERLIKQNLLTGNVEQASFVPFFQVTPSPEDNQKQLEAELKHAVIGPLDVVILGMGNDGHTASLFPCAKDTLQAVARENSDYTAVTHPEMAPHPRLTLTLNRLLASRNIYLLLFGEDKLKTLNKAEQQGDELLMPIRYFLRNTSPALQIYWAP